MRKRRRRHGWPPGLVLAVSLGLVGLALWGGSRLSPVVARAVLYIAAAWGSAAAMTLLAFLAVSVDDLGEIVATALLGSAPAMWFAPGLLLLSAGGRAVESFAMALVAGAAALLASQRAPQRRTAASRPTPRPDEPLLFRGSGLDRSLFAGSLFPALLGALALQAGLCCWYVEYRLAAAALIALASGTWMRSWVSRSTPRGADPPHSPAAHLAAFALALLLTVGASMAAFAVRTPTAAEEAPSGVFEESRRTLARLAHPAPRKTIAPAPAAAIPVFGAREQVGIGSKGIPGVILRPHDKPRQHWHRLAASAPGSLPMPNEVLTFPFTGEYHIFRTSSGQLPEGAPVEEGTPLEAIYVTTNGGSMETHAYQPLNPPVDFTRCGQVWLTLRSGEVFPGGAALQLLSDAGVEDLGTQVFGLDRNAEETLAYFVPATPRRRPVRALRVVFRHDPGQGAKSTRVAIVAFSLAPRSY